MVIPLSCRSQAYNYSVSNCVKLSPETQPESCLLLKGTIRLNIVPGVPDIIEFGADQRLEHCLCCKGFLARTLIEKALPNDIVCRLVLFC